jgi:alkanesulfonate monooxygenase SsuD/methylene tetrahydromethanopterin reductase-like flavin-dependent oxidoreductase (luciferase family)
VRFGTFQLIGSPDVAPARRRFEETLEQIALADELGFGMAWIAEHHFSNYGYSTNPLLLTAKASAMAPRIGFGQAVLVTPFWQPLRLAEDIAMTDCLTGGRLELGLGRGYQRMEFRGLDLPMEESREIFVEQIELMKKAWTEDDFTFEGRYYQVSEPLTVLPRPLQQPHPPIWMAVQSVTSLDWAAAQGYGMLLSATLSSHQQLAEWCDRYRAIRAEAGHQEAPIAIQRFVYVTEREAEAREAVWQTRWQRRVADHLRLDDARLAAGRNEAFPTPDELSDEDWWDRLVYGRPERCIELLRRDAELGISDFMGWFDVGGIGAEQVRRSLQLFAREVVPALADARVS